MLCFKRIEESKDDFSKKRLKRLKRVEDIIKPKGCQKSARIEKMLKMPVLRKTHTFSIKSDFFFLP